MYSVDLLIPTARFVFAVEGERVEVLPEHRSPEAFRAYQEWQGQRPVVGMTTFPNTILLRGPRVIVVDPGLHLQNEPVLRALERRGLAPADVDMVALTHAHLDHAGACADLPAPVAVHEREIASGHWAAVAGVLERRRLVRLSGDEGELVPGVGFARTPGHTDGGVCFRVTTEEGEAVLAGDTVGPLRETFDEMRLPEGAPEGERLLEAWRLIRSWRPCLIVPGHLPPFRP